MHNLVSFNQLADWNTVSDDINVEQDDLINDYYDCLIECDDNQSYCRRLCKEVLV